MKRLQKLNLVFVLFLVVIAASILVYFTFSEKEYVEVSNLHFFNVNLTHITIEYDVQNNLDVDGECISQIKLSGDTQKTFQKSLGPIRAGEKITDIVLTESYGKSKTTINVTCRWLE